MGSVEVVRLFWGWLFLNLFALPLTVLLSFYLVVMGGSHPARPRVWSVLGMVLGFVYGVPLAVLVGLVAAAGVLDGILWGMGFGWVRVSWLGVFLAAVLLVVAGNVFVDNLYQFRRGNYGLSVWLLLMILGFVGVVNWVGGFEP